MTPQQLIGIASRLFAVWLAILSLTYRFAVPTGLTASLVTGNSIVVSRTIGVALLVAALLLWLFPLVVAHRLLPRTSHANQFSVASYDLARVGCSLLGLWLFSQALPSVVWLLFRSFLVVEGTSSYSSLSSENKVEVAVAVFEALLAIVFIVKSKAFARLVVPQAGELPKNGGRASDP